MCDPESRDIDEHELCEMFRAFGANDPESWAKSEIAEDIPQLARFLFLKGAWDIIASEDDHDWIERLVSSVSPESNEPFDGLAHSTRAMLGKGVSAKEIAGLVRSAQAEFFAALCYQLDDPESVAGNDGIVAWRLMELNTDEEPSRPITGLHESVLGNDPTGRECRPFGIQ